MTARQEKLKEARSALAAFVVGIVGDGELPRFDEALTHRSYANESNEPDNQRLEFLGDAVLGLCVSELLTRDHPDADEGALSQLRSSLVNAEVLAAWGRRMKIGDAIAFGKGASATGARNETNVLADAVEAIVAAVYDARGLAGARRLVASIVEEPLREAAQLSTRDPKSLLDPKSLFQEQVQAQGLPTPRYRVRSMRAPPDPSCVIEVLVGEEVRGVGEARSRRLAERAAALAALKASEAPPSPEGEAPSGGG